MSIIHSESGSKKSKTWRLFWPEDYKACVARPVALQLNISLIRLGNFDCIRFKHLLETSKENNVHHKETTKSRHSAPRAPKFKKRNNKPKPLYVSAPRNFSFVY